MSRMIAFGLFILGAAFGSFSLALAHRLRYKMDWVKGRSECEHCKHVLASKDLIPIVSWLMLRGCCRYCKKPLSPHLILSEIGLGSVFAASYIFWPFAFTDGLYVLQFCLWLVLCTVFSALFWYDVTWMLLPNKLVYPLIAISAVDFILQGITRPLFGLNEIGLLVGSIAVSSGLFLLFYTASKGKWIGFGDVRLGVALGLLAATPAKAVLTIFLASCIGTLVVLPAVYVVKRRIVHKLPFGPLLIIAAIVVRLFGERIIDWYLATSGL